MDNNTVGLAGGIDDLEKELSRISGIAEGRTSGIESVHFSLDAITNTLARAAEEADKKAAAEKEVPDLLVKAVYTAATCRDACYATYGRKYMRIRGLQAKSRAAYTRALQLIEAEVGAK